MQGAVGPIIGGVGDGITFKPSGIADTSQKTYFESLLNGSASGGGVSQQLGEVINRVQDTFNKSHGQVVSSIKKFEETGSAVDLMIASHEGSNKSIMVQLVGMVSKKSADSAEQIYKQQ
jgi:hypothetical protein